MANWYKRLFRIGQETYAPINTYTQIGHYWSKYPGPTEPEPVSPNYIWVISKGQVLYKEENPDKETHKLNFTDEQLRNEDKSWNYRGRYESSTGKLSIVVPGGVRRFLEVPNSILSKLYDTFPDIKEIHKF